MDHMGRGVYLDEIPGRLAQNWLKFSDWITMFIEFDNDIEDAFEDL